MKKEIMKLSFKTPNIPIYQDVDALPHKDPVKIKENQIKLMTSPVQWTNITRNMVSNGVRNFYEVGTDDTLQKIVSRMYPDLLVTSIWTCNDYRNIKPYNL